MQFSLSRFAFPGWRWALVAVIVLAVIGYLFLGREGSLGATLTVSRGDFKQRVCVSGTVVAAQDAALGFAASGRIAGVYAKVGQHVGAGTVLAEIENGDLVAGLEQARANLASLLTGTRPEELAVAATTVTNAEATLTNDIRTAYTTSDDAVHNKADVLFTNPRTDPKLSFTATNATLKTVVERDRANIEVILADWALLVAGLTSDNVAASAKQAQAYLAQVVTLLANANLVLNQSVPDQTTSAATLASYSTTISTARTNVNAALATLTADVAALAAAESALALKQAGSTLDAIAAQEAAVRSAQAALAKTRVVAPFGGTVTRMNVRVGEIVSPTTSEISLQSDGIFQVETYVPEVTIVRVAVGNSATTTLDAYGSSVAFASIVVAVDPAETMKDGVPTYKTTLAFLSKDARIRSGMTANVVMETGVLPDAIVIPAGAVGVKDGVSYVSLVDRGMAVARTVTTGPSPALGQVQILSGLSDGDTILLSPAP